jgi:very-short-patch-repair endonuclease
VVRLSVRSGRFGNTPLAKLADRQHGTVATWQLLRLGYTEHVIRRLVAAGWLHRIHRGVYAVGHARLSVKARWMAAVLACGPDAILSHGAAAALHELRAAPGVIDVTTPGQRRVPGIRCHRSRCLQPSDRTVIDGIPVTSIGRTLLDEAESLSHQRLRTIVEAAQRRDLLDSRKLDPLLARSTGHRGATPLQQALNALHEQAPWTQSELERRFLELVRDAGLPEPQCNVVVDGVVVDCFWPRHNLVVELDGYAFHRSRRSFEEDRRKDIRHALAGRRSVRITRAGLSRGVEDLGALLSAAPGAAPGP